jgi:hypothetical protein
VYRVLNRGNGRTMVFLALRRQEGALVLSPLPFRVTLAPHAAGFRSFVDSKTVVFAQTFRVAEREPGAGVQAFIADYP